MTPNIIVIEYESADTFRQDFPDAVEQGGLFVPAPIVLPLGAKVILRVTAPHGGRDYPILADVALLDTSPTSGGAGLAFRFGHPDQREWLYGALAAEAGIFPPEGGFQLKSIDPGFRPKPRSRAQWHARIRMENPTASDPMSAFAPPEPRAAPPVPGGSPWDAVSAPSPMAGAPQPSPVAPKPAEAAPRAAAMDASQFWNQPLSPDDARATLSLPAKQVIEPPAALGGDGATIMMPALAPVTLPRASSGPLVPASFANPRPARAEPAAPPPVTPVAGNPSSPPEMEPLDLGILRVSDPLLASAGEVDLTSWSVDGAAGAKRRSNPVLMGNQPPGAGEAPAFVPTQSTISAWDEALGPLPSKGRIAPFSSPASPSPSPEGPGLRSPRMMPRVTTRELNMDGESMAEEIDEARNRNMPRRVISGYKLIAAGAGFLVGVGLLIHVVTNAMSGEEKQTGSVSTYESTFGAPPPAAQPGPNQPPTPAPSYIDPLEAPLPSTDFSPPPEPPKAELAKQWADKGETWFQKGNMPMARSLFEKAAELDPDNPMVQKRLKELGVKKGPKGK